ncbi:MAG TPA: helix-turn-helix domain-containing protein [Stellaceae bacterium]|nr:helix-turn-helix domain-containing protein [Stellaceae bacterium]
MTIIRFKLDLAHPPELTAKQRARPAAMTEEEIEQNARDDPDNPPLTEDELARMCSARFVRQVREKTGLSQDDFAKRFHISVARMRDLEQGRTTADSAFIAYLQVIARAQKTVERDAAVPGREPRHLIKPA